MTLVDCSCALYDELKGWQAALGAALGAVLGIVALILAAQRHFRLNRRRDKELKDEEAQSVMAALYGEILILRNEVARLANGVAIVSRNRGVEANAVIQLNQHFVDSHTVSEPLLYKMLASKLGLLNVDTMMAIIEALVRHGRPAAVLQDAGVDLVLPQYRQRLALRVVVKARQIDKHGFIE